MSTPYLKSDLVAELAKGVTISKRKTDALLALLAQIAYREARHGFTVPGICRLDVVTRKARRARVPSTGQQLLIGAHDMLRVRPLRKAKNAVTPKPADLVQVLTNDADDADAAAVTHAAAPALHPGNAEGLVSFRCASCGQEIEAPSDMAGTNSECPTCGSAIEVPYLSEPGTIWGPTIAETPSEAAATPASPQFAEPTAAMKGRTIRIELPDDI